MQLAESSWIKYTQLINPNSTFKDQNTSEVHNFTYVDFIKISIALHASFFWTWRLLKTNLPVKSVKWTKSMDESLVFWSQKDVLWRK